MAVSNSLRYLNRGTGQTAIASPQFSGNSSGATSNGTNTGNRVYLTVPGCPSGGTYTVTFGGVTSAPIAANASGATLQSALQAMSSIGSALTVTASQVITQNAGYQYQIDIASGFTFQTAPGMCDGSLMTGQSLKDVYRFYPYPYSYSGTFDAYGLGYFAFTENPTSSPPPRHLAVQGGGPVGSYQCSAIILTVGDPSRLPLITNNKITDLVMDSGAPYGVPLVIAKTLDTHVSGCSFAGGTYGVAHFPCSANYYERFYDCSFSGRDACFYGDSVIVTFKDITIANNNRYAFRFLGCEANLRGLRDYNYGTDPCCFVAFFSGSYGGIGTFEDIQLDFEGGALNRALFYVDQTGAAPSWLRVRDLYAGGVGRRALLPTPELVDTQQRPGRDDRRRDDHRRLDRRDRRLQRRELDRRDPQRQQRLRLVRDRGPDLRAARGRGQGHEVVDVPPLGQLVQGHREAHPSRPGRRAVRGIARRQGRDARVGDAPAVEGA